MLTLASRGGEWGLGKYLVDNAPSVGILRGSNNLVDARDTIFLTEGQFRLSGQCLSGARGRPETHAPRGRHAARGWSDTPRVDRLQVNRPKGGSPVERAAIE